MRPRTASTPRRQFSAGLWDATSRTFRARPYSGSQPRSPSRATGNPDFGLSWRFSNSDSRSRGMIRWTLGPPSKDGTAMTTEMQLSTYGLDRPESGDDVVVPFTLDALDCRGRVVRLADALDAILSRHNYPAPVARLLGEAVVLAALIGSSLKFEGKFILQTQTDGPVNLIVVDLDAPDGLRGYARFDADAVMQAIQRGETKPGQLLGKGHLDRKSVV